MMLTIPTIMDDFANSMLLQNTSRSNSPQLEQAQKQQPNIPSLAHCSSGAPPINTINNNRTNHHMKNMNMLCTAQNAPPAAAAWMRRDTPELQLQHQQFPSSIPPMLKNNNNNNNNNNNKQAQLKAEKMAWIEHQVELNAIVAEQLHQQSKQAPSIWLQNQLYRSGHWRMPIGTTTTTTVVVGGGGSGVQQQQQQQQHSQQQQQQQQHVNDAEIRNMSSMPPLLLFPQQAAHLSPQTQSQASSRVSNCNSNCNSKDIVMESDIQDLDVLCGRGGKSNHHPGNKYYRQVVSEMRNMYHDMPAKHGKTGLGYSIVDYIEARGGRFLKQKSKHQPGIYIVLNKAEARRKTSQALRETKQLKWTL